MNLKIYCHNISQLTQWHAEIIRVFESIEIQKMLAKHYKIMQRTTNASGFQSQLNRIIKSALKAEGWISEHSFKADNDLKFRLDFYKNKTILEVSFANKSTIGKDLFCMIAGINKANIADTSIYVVPTKDMTQKLSNDHKNMLTYERALQYVNLFGDLIPIPMLIIGIHPTPSTRIGA